MSDHCHDNNVIHMSILGFPSFYPAVPASRLLHELAETVLSPDTYVFDYSK